MGFQVVCQTKEIAIDQVEPELLRLIKPYLPGQEQILICLENKTEQNLTGLFGNQLLAVMSNDIVHKKVQRHRAHC